MKKQHLLLAFLLAIAGLAIVFFVRPQNGPELKAEQIHLLALIPQTGPSANFGQDDREAISLAIDHFQNEFPEVDVSVDFQDTKGDKGQALSAFNASLAMRKPDILFVESSGASLAVLPLVNQHSIFTVSVAAHPEVTEQSKFVFRCLPTASQESEKILSHVIDQRGLKKISLLTLNNDYGVSYVQPFNEITRRLGATLVLTEQYASSDSDFRAISTKIASSDSEALFIVGYGKGMGILIRQLREQGYKGLLLATSGVVYPEVLDEAGSAAKGLQYADVPFRTNSTNPAASKFSTEYKHRFDRHPTPFASTVYDGTIMALEAMLAANLDASLAANNLVAAKQTQGANGVIGISATRDLLFNLEIRTIGE